MRGSSVVIESTRCDARVMLQGVGQIVERAEVLGRVDRAAVAGADGQDDRLQLARAELWRQQVVALARGDALRQDRGVGRREADVQERGSRGGAGRPASGRAKRQGRAITSSASRRQRPLALVGPAPGGT